MGRQQALRLLLTSETIDALEARRIGLVDRVVDTGQVLVEAEDLARRICANPPGPVRSFLELARVAEDAETAKAVELEAGRFGDSWVSMEFGKALEQFLKRKE